MYVHTTSRVVQSNVYCLKCFCSIIYITPIYPLIWCTTGSDQSHYHWSSVPLKSWNIIAAWNTYSIPIWCKPVPSRSSTIRSRSVSMTEKSSGVRGANITDLHIAMVRDDFAIQTEVDIC